MSGVEVVGILLGAMPLVVSALKSYKDTKQRYIWFMSKEPYINRLIQSLNEQIYFIKADIDVALRSADLEHDMIKKFLINPDLNLLRNHEVAEAIQDHLGEGFQLYLDALAHCQDTICTIVENLNGLVSGTRRIEAADLAAIVNDTPKKNGKFEFRKKIKFSLQKEDIDAQITDLEASTKILSRINKQSTRRETVTVQSNSRTITKFASTFSSIRDSAHRLYSAISRGYIHTCHDQHEVRLFLQTRSSLVEGTKARSLRKPPVAFEMAFCMGLDRGSSQGTWSYKTEVTVIERYGDNDNTEDGLKDSVHKSQPIVTFSLPDSSETTNPGLNDIDNLCTLLHSTHTQRSPLAICLSEGKLCFIDRPAPNTTVTTQPVNSLSVVTLRELITGGSTDMPGVPLNHRIALSYNIASAVLQLHSTPWLTLPLTSSSIYFVPDNSTKYANSSTSTKRYFPFIKAVFQNCRNDCATCRYNIRDSMLELGILLLELWHAHSLEKFATDSGFKLTRAFTSRYEVAQEWIAYSEDQGDMMPFYLEAATRCIECTFTTSSARPNWNDFTFQKSVCQYVFKPLLDICPSKYR